jgi:hypothetical protein
VQFFSGPDKDHLALNGKLVFAAEEWAKFGFALFNGARRLQRGEIHYEVDVDDPEVWADVSKKFLQFGEVDFPYALPPG